MEISQPYKLLDSDGYDSSSSSSSSSSASPDGPIVFCIHGNKWGVANCCEDIDYQNSAEHEPMVGNNIYHLPNISAKGSNSQLINKKNTNFENIQWPFLFILS